jgi:hypothetical protein
MLISLMYGSADYKNCCFKCLVPDVLFPDVVVEEEHPPGRSDSTLATSLPNLLLGCCDHGQFVFLSYQT